MTEVSVESNADYGDLAARLRATAQSEGGAFFLGWPDRWQVKPHYRCVNNHVSTCLLKSEEHGRSECLSCRGPVVLTFPEDSDGPLLPPPTPSGV